MTETHDKTIKLTPTKWRFTVGGARIDVYQDSTFGQWYTDAHLAGITLNIHRGFDTDDEALRHMFRLLCAVGEGARLATDKPWPESIQ